MSTVGRSTPHMPTHPAGDEAVVAGDDLERHAELPELRDGVERTRLRRVLEQQEPDEGHLLLVVLVDDRVIGHVPDRDAQHAIALFAVGLEALLQGSAHLGDGHGAGCAGVHPRLRIDAGLEHVPQRALGDHRVPVRVG